MASLILESVTEKDIIPSVWNYLNFVYHNASLMYTYLIHTSCIIIYYYTLKYNFFNIFSKFKDFNFDIIYKGYYI